MEPATKAGRAALRKVITDAADQEFAKRYAEWEILGMDANHPTVVEATYQIVERVNRDLKKLDEADEAENTEYVDPNPPIVLPWLNDKE